MAYLMDTGFWYASIDESDQHYAKVAPVADKIREIVVLPIPVITETAYLISRNKNVEALAIFSEGLARTLFQLEAPTAEDYLRTAEILRKYDDANIDFVDACIVAIAERLSITKILTVDRRHFGIFKPRHCAAFEILP
ncbi:MAG: PIN domain-containing protein [Pyrinomonadaceae bacterium]|nr:PIN domain-containing protein [Pyrinomonadaceae bacterium]